MTYQKGETRVSNKVGTKKEDPKKEEKYFLLAREAWRKTKAAKEAKLTPEAGNSEGKKKAELKGKLPGKLRKADEALKRAKANCRNRSEEANIRQERLLKEEKIKEKKMRQYEELKEEAKKCAGRMVKSQ